MRNTLCESFYYEHLHIQRTAYMTDLIRNALKNKTEKRNMPAKKKITSSSSLLPKLSGSLVGHLHQ